MFKLICTVALLTIGSAFSAACLVAENFDLATHTRSYNNFHELETADTLLQGRKDFSKFLDAADEVITAYELEGEVGFRLIHRHFELPAGCVMLEQFQVYEGEPSLITAPIPVSEAQSKGAVPSGWTFNSSGIDVFEFSTDSGVKAALKKLEARPDFLRTIGAVIKDFDLESLMSISLLRKESLLAGAGQFYQERTLSIGSVVQIENGEYNEDAGTRTAWTFGKGPRMLACFACRNLGNGNHPRVTHYYNPKK